MPLQILKRVKTRTVSIYVHIYVYIWKDIDIKLNQSKFNKGENKEEKK